MKNKPFCVALFCLRNAFFIAVFCLLFTVCLLNLPDNNSLFQSSKFFKNTIVAEADNTHVHDNLEYTMLTADYLEGKSVLKGNFYLDSSLTITKEIKLSGIVNLCLNGKTLTIGSELITLNKSATLNIYSSEDNSDDAGKIITTNSSGGAICIKGNSSNTVNIYGGAIVVECKYSATAFSNIDTLNICGGSVTVKGSASSKLTDSDKGYEMTAGYVNVNGTVTNMYATFLEDATNEANYGTYGSNTPSENEGQEDKKCEHNYVESVITPATCTEDGELQKQCSICGDTQKEVIPKLNHKITGISTEYCKDYKSAYNAFEQFDLTNVFITVFCENCTSFTTTDFTIYYNAGDCLHANDDGVNVSFTYDDKTYTASFAVTVSKITVQAPNKDDTTFTYDGKEKTYSLPANDSLYTITDNTQTSAGKYKVKVSLTDATNYIWSNNSSSALEYDFAINKAELVCPTIESKIYNGKLQTAEVVIPDEYKNIYSVAQNNGGTNVGGYDVKIVIDNDNYQWKSGSNTATLTFYITKATAKICNLTLADWSYSDNANVPTATIDSGLDADCNFNLNELVYSYSDKEDGVYTSTIPSAVGNYFVKAYWAGNDNFNSAEATASFAITRKEITAPTIENVIYDGKLHRAYVEDNENYYVSENEGGTDVGSYKVTLIAKDNYIFGNNKSEATVFLIISPAENYFLSFDVENCTYGQTLAPTAKASFGEVTFYYATAQGGTYTLNSPTSAGSYVVKAYVAGNDNYSEISAEKEVIIYRAKVNKPNVAEQTFTYNGSEQIFEVEEGESYIITNNKQTAAGEYKVYVTLVDKINCAWNGSENEENAESGDIVYDFVISKATYDMSGITFVGASIDEDGAIHSLAIAGQLPVGVSVKYTGNGQTSSGDYLVTATFVGNENYCEIPSLTAHLIINKVVADNSDGESNGGNEEVGGNKGNSSDNVSSTPSTGEDSESGNDSSSGDTSDNNINNNVSGGSSLGGGNDTDSVGSGDSNSDFGGTSNSGESEEVGGSNDGYLPDDTTTNAGNEENNTTDTDGSDYIIEVSAKPKANIPGYVYWIIATISFVFGAMALSSAVYFIRGKLREKKNRKDFHN